MRKQVGIGICAALLLLALAAGVKLRIGIGLPVEPEQASLPHASYGERLQTEPRREALDSFIRNRLTGTYGVYTNLQETDHSREAASGHEVLSESAGLLLRYYARSGQRDRYDAEWTLAKRTFELGSGFSYRYSPLHNKRYPLNAAVDDLRIIRSLHEAAEAFPSGPYMEEANAYGDRFIRNNILDGYMYDFYDESVKRTNSFITLAYIDLRTLQLLPLATAKRDTLTANMLRIARGGYISDTFPFYESRYDYESKTYRSDTIQTVESLLTILALAEVGQHEPASIRYVKEQVAAGTLYGQYTREGRPAGTVRSTAIYAIAAMIGSVAHDADLYESSIRRMNEFQITDKNSPLYGGFADARSGQAYSYDNLTALLAYEY